MPSAVVTSALTTGHAGAAGAARPLNGDDGVGLVFQNPEDRPGEAQAAGAEKLAAKQPGEIVLHVPAKAAKGAAHVDFVIGLYENGQHIARWRPPQS